MSSKKAMVDQWLMELNKQWGLDCLKLDADNSCHLSAGDYDLSFILTEDENELVLWSPVGSAHRFLDSNELMEKLLVMNDGDSHLKGATFSIDRNRQHVHLSYRVAVESLDAQRMGDLLCNFGETISGVIELLVTEFTHQASTAAHSEDQADQRYFTRV